MENKIAAACGIILLMAGIDWLDPAWWLYAILAVPVVLYCIDWLDVKPS